jgi:hypothetical protein
MYLKHVFRLLPFLLHATSSGLAGDISVQRSNSILSLVGSASADSFSITGNGSSITVTSTSGTTTIGGKNQQTIRSSTPLSIKIELGRGEDVCEIQDLACHDLTIVDSSKNRERDIVSLRNVSVNRNISVAILEGDDVVSGSLLSAGLTISMSTGAGNDIVASHGLQTTLISIQTGAGDDLVVAGEFDCQTAQIIGGSDTWTYTDLGDLLSGDTIIHMDFFEVTQFDILGASQEFENKLSLMEDVIDTPLEDELEAMESEIGFF